MVTPKTLLLLFMAICLHGRCHEALAKSNSLSLNGLTYKIVTVGGFRQHSGYTTSVDKIDPTASNGRCQKLADYPLPVGGMTVQNMGQNMLVACGGGQECDEGSKTCYYHLANSTQG